MIVKADFSSTQTYSVNEAAQILGFERTTVYRLIWRDEIRLCKGAARFRITRAEIERFVGRDETYSARAARRPKTVRPQRARKFAGTQPVVSRVVSHRTIFVPSAQFGDRQVDGRLMASVVSDDDALEPESFIEVDEAEWAIIGTS